MPLVAMKDGMLSSGGIVKDCRWLLYHISTRGYVDSQPWSHRLLRNGFHYLAEVSHRFSSVWPCWLSYRNHPFLIFPCGRTPPSGFRKVLFPSRSNTVLLLHLPQSKKTHEKDTTRDCVGISDRRKNNTAWRHHRILLFSFPCAGSHMNNKK